jgi:hypothetical protein
MSIVFSLPKEIPQHIPEVPLYRATKYATFSRKNEDVKAGLNERVERYQKLFKMKAAAEDQGTQVVLRDNLRVLEVYIPSDSFWWTDLEVAYREKIPDGSKMPGDEEAKKMALKYMNDLCPWRQNAKIVSVDKSLSAVSQAKGKTLGVVDTEIQVNFAFSIDDFPVMGPGAKVKVSLVEGGRLSNFLCFWRELTKEKTVKTIHPLVALDRLIHEPRFAHFTPEKVSVSLEQMRFGYYALPPFEFQRYLVPVYEVKATLKTELLGSRSLVLYTLGIESIPEVLKKSEIFDQPDIARRIASTK